MWVGEFLQLNTTTQPQTGPVCKKQYSDETTKIRTILNNNRKSGFIYASLWSNLHDSTAYLFAVSVYATKTRSVVVTKAQLSLQFGELQ